MQDLLVVIGLTEQFLPAELIMPVAANDSLWSRVKFDIVSKVVQKAKDPTKSEDSEAQHRLTWTLDEPAKVSHAQSGSRVRWVQVRLCQDGMRA